jgi:hypothetical protein
MKIYVEAEVQGQPLLTLEVDEDEWSALRLGCFTPRQEPQVTIG